MWKWEQYRNVWIFVNLPIITIEPDGKGNWQACCGGRPVSQIPAGKIIDDVMRRTMDYYDARIEMETVKERWL